MKRPCTRWPLLGSILVSLATSADASGHEGPNLATEISVEGDRVAVQTKFGLLLGPSDAPTPSDWRWTCMGALGIREIENPDPFFLNGDTLLIPSFDGLFRGTDDACTWGAAAPELDRIEVLDGQRHPERPDTAFVITSSGQRPNAVYRTEDGGRTWAPTSEPLPDDLYETIHLAPSRPQRIYLGGVTIVDDPIAPYAAVTHVSDDEGRTWARFVTELQSTERNFQILGVDPSDPDHLIARVISRFGDRLVQSFDGGQSYAPIMNLALAQGFLWSEDGQEVWVTGSEGTGLLHSNDGGRTFETVRPNLSLHCLAFVNGELWACGGDELEASISRSTDGGRTFQTVLDFAQELPVTVPCGADTVVGAICPGEVNEVRDDFGREPLPEPDAGLADVGTGPSDAGDGGPVSPDGGSTGGPLDPSGSGCQAVPASTQLAPLAALGLCLALARSAHRRREAGRKM